MRPLGCLLGDCLDHLAGCLDRIPGDLFDGLDGVGFLHLLHDLVGETGDLCLQPVHPWVLEWLLQPRLQTTKALAKVNPWFGWRLDLLNLWWGSGSSGDFRRGVCHGFG
jgi:hypothetical protein